MRARGTAAQGGEVAQGDDLAGLRVLLVEDEVLACLEVEDLLRTLGCQVVGPAARVAEAVRLASEAGLDGALVDLNLGGETSYPVIDALVERAVPYVLVTGYDLPNVALRYRDAPYIGKPFGEGAVLAAVRRFRETRAGTVGNTGIAGRDA